MTLFLAILVGVLASGGIVTALWAAEFHRAEAETRARRAQPGMVWLDCNGPCRRLHGPHVQHDDGRVTCCLCGGIHSTSIPQQRQASDGS